MENGSRIEKRSCYLGKAYFFGEQDLVQNELEGLKLIKRAAKNGFQEALEFLSKVDGVQKIYRDAFDEFNRRRPSK